MEESLVQEQEHHRMRTLPIDDATLEMLGDYIQRGGPVLRQGKMLIFGINRHRAWQIVRECVKKAGLPDLVNPETGKRHGVSPPLERRIRCPCGKDRVEAVAAWTQPPTI